MTCVILWFSRPSIASTTQSAVKLKRNIWTLRFSQKKPSKQSLWWKLLTLKTKSLIRQCQLQHLKCSSFLHFLTKVLLWRQLNKLFPFQRNILGNIRHVCFTCNIPVLALMRLYQRANFLLKLSASSQSNLSPEATSAAQLKNRCEIDSWKLYPKSWFNSKTGHLSKRGIRPLANSSSSVSLMIIFRF